MKRTHGPKAVWTNLGAISDPVADTWTPVSAPLGTQWSQIGDAQSIVLANGQFMLGACCTCHPTANALFNPKTFGWETNYPIVRFTNVDSGHVVYARSAGFSSYSIAANALSQANFTVPSTIESGNSVMEVVANGVASKPSVVTVK